MYRLNRQTTCIFILFALFVTTGCYVDDKSENEIPPSEAELSEQTRQLDALARNNYLFDGQEITHLKYKQLLKSKIDKESISKILLVGSKNKDVVRNRVSKGIHAQELFKTFKFLNGKKMVNGSALKPHLFNNRADKDAIEGKTTPTLLDSDLKIGKMVSVGTNPGSGNPYAEVDKTRGIFFAADGKSSIAKVIMPLTPSIEKEKQIRDAKILTATDLYLEKSGVDKEEVDRIVTSSVSESVVPGEEPLIKEQNRVVYINRKIDGIPVPNNKFVLSYHLDGELNTMIGLWQQINYQKSRLQSAKKDVLEIEDAIVEELISRGSDPFTLDSIEARTVYSIIENEDGDFTLDLSAEVSCTTEMGDISDLHSFVMSI